jgi:hypothetical protein
MSDKNNEAVRDLQRSLIERTTADIEECVEFNLNHGKCCDPNCSMWAIYEDLLDEELSGAIKIVARLRDQNPMLDSKLFTHLVEEQLERRDGMLDAAVLDDGICQVKEKQ